MHEFPPPTWYMTGWWPTVYHGLVSLTGLILAFSLRRKNRTPRVRDTPLIIITGMTTLVLLAGPVGTKWEWSLPASPLTFLSVMVLFLVALLFPSIHSPLKPTSGSCDPLVWIVAILLSFFSALFLLAMAAQNSPIQSSWRTSCRNNLTYIGLALHNYHDAFESFPESVTGRPPRSWRVDVLPYIEKYSYWNADDSGFAWNYECNPEFAWDHERNREIAEKPVPTYQCPAHPESVDQVKYPRTDYLAVVGESTIWPRSASTNFRDVADGLSSTLMVVEACGTAVAWAEPRDLPFAEAKIGVNLPGEKRHQSDAVLSSYHQRGAYSLFGDGSVRFMSNEIDADVLRALLTATGGEIVSDEDF